MVELDHKDPLATFDVERRPMPHDRVFGGARAKWGRRNWRVAMTGTRYSGWPGSRKRTECLSIGPA